MHTPLHSTPQEVMQNPVLAYRFGISGWECFFSGKHEEEFYGSLDA